MKFKIGDKIYDRAEIADVSVWDLAQLAKENGPDDRPLTLATIQDMGETVNALSEKEQSDHPYTMWLTIISIWAARLLAGEDLTVRQALSFRLSDMTIIPDPQDHKAPANPTKARPARKVSGRAAKSAPRRAATPKTSSPPSTDA